MPDLELAGVAKRFGHGADAVVALEPIDLAIDHDEVVAVVGPSGCGKTTLLRMVAGLEPPTAGGLTVDGRPLWDQRHRPDRQALRQVGVMFQEANLLPWMRVEANVALPLRIHGVGRAERRQRARDLCRLTGIDGFEHRRPRELSVGMRQRAALARAIIDSPRILLLDEPFAALDGLTREALNQELQRIHGAQPHTMVLVTHSITEAVLLADRVVSLTARPGRVAGITTVPFARPRPESLQHTPAFQEVVRQVRANLGEAVAP